MFSLSYIWQISPEKFEEAFGASMDKASELLAAKTLSISKLLVLAPPGTLDPTPHLYDSTMYTLAGLTSVAVLAHAMVRPIQATPSVQQVLEVAAEVKEVNAGAINAVDTAVDTLTKKNL